MEFMQWIQNPYAVAGLIFVGLYKLLDKYMDIRHKLQERNFERQEKVEQARIEREQEWHEASLDMSKRQVQKLNGLITEFHDIKKELQRNDAITKVAHDTSMENKTSIDEIKKTIAQHDEHIDDHEERIAVLEQQKTKAKKQVKK